MTQTIGQTSKGATVQAVTLENSHHRIEVWTLGARLASWRMGEIQVLDPVQGIAHAEGKGRNHAPVILPVANRIGAATALLDGTRLTFEANEGSNSLHSGAAGSQFANWRIDDATATSVRLTLDQPDGEGGFPGNRALRVDWTLADDTLTLEITATTDRPTFINPAFHPYFRMAEGSRLQVVSDEIVAIGEGKIPTGQIAQVAGTPFDLRVPVTPPDTIDHCYLVSGDITRPIARLAAPDYALAVATDAPGLQVFTGKPGLVALEPEIHPDAPNHADFPDIVLRPGQTFRQISHWTVTRP